MLPISSTGTTYIPLRRRLGSSWFIFLIRTFSDKVVRLIDFAVTREKERGCQLDIQFLLPMQLNWWTTTYGLADLALVSWRRLGFVAFHGTILNPMLTDGEVSYYITHVTSDSHQVESKSCTCSQLEEVHLLRGWSISTVLV